MKAFSITPPAKGVHFTFPNGWTVSVQWGPGNYSDNHANMTKFSEPADDSNTAEVWAWDKDDNADGEPRGWQSVDEVFDYIAEIRKR